MTQRLPIPPEKMAVYRATARQREQARRAAVEARRVCALALAQTASQLLKQQFGAQRVVLFGSILTPAFFHERSDIDLAVWGLNERLYLRALGRLLDLDPNFEFDLVEFEVVPPRLQASIQKEGQELILA
ncbi:MAG: nucleotidyltransferase domain-containing protein [Anaerolineae bacterium]|nr:nucleotidyltransferase domain-containing protein [Anaerolineae bacterium]